MEQRNQLIDKIINGDFLSREHQIDGYRQYFDDSYNYDTRENDYVSMPDHLIIFWSWYKYEDYSGDGEVWGYNTESDMFFNVSGSHCSCYGLEGQWDEEEYTFEEMVAVLERVTSNEQVYDVEKNEDQKSLLKMIKGETNENIG